MNKQDLINRRTPQETTAAQPISRGLHIVIAEFIFKGDKVLLIHHKKLNLWLPVGGHIEQNETPDAAVLREAREEIGLEVEIIQTDPTPQCGQMKEKLCVPFHVSVHSVGDHDHCCLNYVCKVKSENIEHMNKDELNNFKWFTKDDLNQANISPGVKAEALTAFKVYEKANQQ
ncbi:MAG: NUDIX domain-containing protein [Candidatus Micrarchaeota archaeon]